MLVPALPDPKPSNLEAAVEWYASTATWPKIDHHAADALQALLGEASVGDTVERVTD